MEREPGSDAICVDVESTGLVVGTDRVVALGMVRITDGRITARWDGIFHPGREALEAMGEAAQAVHGLETSDLEQAAPFTAQWEAIATWIDEHGAGAATVAHNADFDQAMLAQEIERAGEPAHRWCDRDEWEDTLERSRREFGRQGGRHGLDALAKRLGVAPRPAGRHDALADAELLARCWIGWRQPGTADLFGTAGDKEGEEGPAPAALPLAAEAGARDEWEAWWTRRWTQ